MERRRGQDTLNYFMRVHVALPVSKPLRHGGFIVDSDGEHTWVLFKYERLPIFCYFCGILGHDLRHCASHYAVERHGGGEVDYQYGEWLKAIGGWQRSPIWRSTKKTSPVNNHGEEAEIQEVEIANDGLDKLNQLDKSEKHGRNPDIQQRDNLGDKGNVDIDNTYDITNNMEKNDENFKSLFDSFKENNVTAIDVNE